MALSWSVVLAVLGGALLHAAWNALVKSAHDKPVDTALVHVLGALCALPLVLLAGAPRPESWPYLAASLVIHVGYLFALAGAYRYGELGLTYPVMRGLAPLLVALGSAGIVGEAPSAAAWLGIVAIAAGVALVGLAHPGAALHRGKALGFAFANAAMIALYTFVDGLGARASGDALRYALTLSLLNGWAYPLIVWRGRSAAQRREIVAYARRRWPLAALGGVASFASYGIALWAMTQAPVASVAALRETSVLFAAVLGTLLLKERFGVQRVAGTVVIVGGVMALRVG